MKTKAAIVIQSHLNDALIEINFNKELAATRLRFVKYLVFKFEDTNTEINPKEEFNLFLEEEKQHA